MDSFETALVYTPGDNEWTDCHRGAAGGHDPLERLGALRARFFASPGPLGGPPGARAALAFERQPGQPENARWRVGAVRFVSLHVVGSANGLKGRAARPDEVAARMRRNRSWLDDTVRVALAERADALVIASHADPDFESRPEPAFVDWIDALRDAAEAFTRPILLLHGDSHRFVVDRPLHDRQGHRIAHVTRVIAFGWPFSASWVRIAFEPADPQRFRIAIREVPRQTSP
jgi:hypothetical protein